MRSREGRKELSAGKEGEGSSAAAPYGRLDFPRFKVDDDDEDGALNRV